MSELLIQQFIGQQIKYSALSDASTDNGNATNKDTKSRKVLVVDDDPDILEAVKLMLEIEDYHVVTDLGDSVDITIQENNPSMLLLDILLNGKDGRDICRKLKKQQTTNHIPIVLISAHADVRSCAKECGADGYLPKPFDMDALLETVGKYVSKDK